jgi:hypothetical protein
MKLTIRCLLALLVIASLGPAARAAEPDARLAPLLPLVGKTWRGELSAPGAAHGVVDVHRFELDLGGRAVRSVHSVNDGEYGGEALYTWDDAQKTIVYTYVTTGGFYTIGTLRAQADGGFVSHEVVHGTAGGVREVEARSRVLPDGRLHVKARQLTDGRWVDGHEAYYSPDPKAVVRFKD